MGAIGRIVEAGLPQTILNEPRHPYTQSLVAAIPGLSGLAGTESESVG